MKQIKYLSVFTFFCVKNPILLEVPFHLEFCQPSQNSDVADYRYYLGKFDFSLLLLTKPKLSRDSDT